MNTTNLDTTSLISQGAAVTIAPAVSAHLSKILIEMLPFCYVGIPLIILDLYYTRKKALFQYKNNITETPVKLHESIKMTIQKIFNYISWIFLSVSLSSAFGMPSLVIVIMAIIYGLEVMSLLNKFGESKGIDIDEVGMVKVLFKFIWSRLTGNFDETFNDVVKKQHMKKQKTKKKQKLEQIDLKGEDLQ